MFQPRIYNLMPTPAMCISHMEHLDIDDFNSPPTYQDPTLEFLRKFTIGLVSGTISSCVNIPFDVAKSRIQGPQPVPGEIKYRTCFQTMALVYREEGYGTLMWDRDGFGSLGAAFNILSPPSVAGASKN